MTEGHESQSQILPTQQQLKLVFSAPHDFEAVVTKMVSNSQLRCCASAGLWITGPACSEDRFWLAEWIRLNIGLNRRPSKYVWIFFRSPDVPAGTAYLLTGPAVASAGSTGSAGLCHFQLVWLVTRWCFYPELLWEHMLSSVNPMTARSINERDRAVWLLSSFLSASSRACAKRVTPCFRRFGSLCSFFTVFTDSRVKLKKMRR